MHMLGSENQHQSDDWDNLPNEPGASRVSILSKEEDKTADNSKHDELPGNGNPFMRCVLKCVDDAFIKSINFLRLVNEKKGVCILSTDVLSNSGICISYVSYIFVNIVCRRLTDAIKTATDFCTNHKNGILKLLEVVLCIGML